MEYVVGASFIGSNNPKVIAWFNNQPYHALPLTLNLIYNAILKGINGSEYGIEVQNEPLPFTQETKVRKRIIKKFC